MEEKLTISEIKEKLEQEKNELAIKQSEIELPILKPEIDKEKNFSEQAKDFVGVMATVEAIKDDKLVKKVTEHKKDELESKAEADKKTEQAKNKEAEKKLQDGIFGVYEGVAQYAGLKRALPEKMLRRIMWVLQPIVGFFLIIFGTIASIINVTMDAINSVAEKFSTLANHSKNIIKVLLIAIGGMLVVLIIRAIFANYGIILF